MKSFLEYRGALQVEDLSAGESIRKVERPQFSDSREVLTRGFGEHTMGLNGI